MPCDDGPIDVFLQPGDLFVADASYRIRTVLGSCVSITLWHPGSACGGMSHFLLPTRGNELTGTRHDELDGRYGDAVYVEPMFEVGGRFHFRDKVTLTMRLGIPFITVGVSWML